MEFLILLGDVINNKDAVFIQHIHKITHSNKDFVAETQ